MEFSIITIQKYEIKDSKIILTDYFNGEMPTSTRFNLTNYPTVYGYYSKGSIYFELYSEEDAGYELYPTFSENNFSGTVYKIGENREFSELSVLKGTFTTEVAGTTNCKLTLSVTEAPEVLSFFVGKQLVFEQH